MARHSVGGVNPENGPKLALTIAFIGVVLLPKFVVARVIAHVVARRAHESAGFWTAQVIALATAVVLLLGLISRVE